MTKVRIKWYGIASSKYAKPIKKRMYLYQLIPYLNFFG